MAVCFVVSEKQSSEQGIPIEPRQTLPFTSHTAVPRLALSNCVCSQHSAELLPWAPLSALPDQCSFPPCWEAEVLPHHRDICTASALREMCMFLCIVENTLENLYLSRNRLAAGLVSWQSGPQTGLLILLKSHHRSKNNLSHGSGRMWDHLAGAQTGTFWHSGVMLSLALKPGRGWDRVEPSQVQKLSSLEGNLWHN